MSTHLSSNFLQKILVSYAIWVASSLVGAKIKLIGPSFSYSTLWSRIWRNIGSKYARVLPEPVSAIPITSLPFIMAGKAYA